MLLDLTATRRLLFVGGKGGTGKTTVSSALSLAHAEAGEAVLLVSTDPAHNLGDIWDLDLGDAPRRVHTAAGRGGGAAGLVDAVEVDPQATIDAHFASVEDMMRRMLPERTHRAVRDHLRQAKKAPGSHESAILERLATIIDDAEGTYDRVIVDTAPTGHTLHLLSLPAQLGGWAETLLANRDRSERFAAAARSLVSPKEETPGADRGLRRTLVARRDRFARLKAAITDHTQTGFLAVSLAERLPTVETAELVKDLGEIGVDLVGVVINRRSPGDEGDFLAARREIEDTYVATMERTVAPAPVVELPLLPQELTGADGIGELARRFGGELA